MILLIEQGNEQVLSSVADNIQKNRIIDDMLIKFNLKLKEFEQCDPHEMDFR